MAETLLIDTPPLSAEYHKARRQLMLWSGLLFAWALVGVDLEKLAKAGGNIGAFVSSVKSPQAIPWVIVILILYFFFRVTIEWKQSADARRGTRTSRVDFGVAWSVALAANLLYFGQLLAKVQFIDLIKTGAMHPLTFAMLISAMGMVFILLLSDNHLWVSVSFPLLTRAVNITMALTILIIMMQLYVWRNYALLTAVVVYSLACIRRN